MKLSRSLFKLGFRERATHNFAALRTRRLSSSINDKEICYPAVSIWMLFRDDVMPVPADGKNTRLDKPLRTALRDTILKPNIIGTINPGQGEWTAAPRGA